MKLLVTQILKDYKGEGIVNEKNEKVTLRDVISISLNVGTVQGDKPMTAEDKNTAFQISVRLWSNEEIDLTVEQLAFIKERVGMVYNPLIYGRVCEILEGKTQETK